MSKGCLIFIAAIVLSWLLLIVLGILTYFGLTSLAPA